MSGELTAKGKREFCQHCGNGVVVAAGFKHDPRCPNAPLVDEDDGDIGWLVPPKRNDEDGV